MYIISSRYRPVYPRVLLQRPPPNTFFHNNSNQSASQHSPSPRVEHLAQARPEAVLLPPPCLQLNELMRVLVLVPSLLAFFVLLVAADESQVEVVGHGAQQDERVKRASGVQNNEGEVNESITEVAINRAVSSNPALVERIA